MSARKLGNGQWVDLGPGVATTPVGGPVSGGPIVPAVSKQEAAAARAYRRCVNGHELTPVNTYRDANGWRSCIECRRAASRESARRRRLS